MKLKITHSSLAIIVALLLLSAVIELCFSFEKKQFDSLNSKKNIDLQQKITNVVNEQINDMIVSLKILNFSLKSDNYSGKSFNLIAKKIIEENPSISELQFAPMGVITKTYPKCQQYSAIGHDLNHIKKRQKGVLLSMTNKKLTLIGPVRLIQNNRLAFILRLPIFDNNVNFKGFIIAISYIENIKNKLPLENCFYKIEGFNPDGEVLTIFNNMKINNSTVLNYLKVQVPNGEWSFTIQNENFNENNSYIIRYILYLSIVIYIYNREGKIKNNHNLIIDINETLYKASFTDELTMLPNRRYINHKLEVISKSITNQTHSIAMLDLDHFKMINDTYGHDIGDKVLIFFSNICLESIRSTDIISRWGGEEFILLMENTKTIHAEEICSRILHALSEHIFTFNNQTFSVTVSIGLSSFTLSDYQIDTVIKNIDNALYISKRTGRNKITVL